MAREDKDKVPELAIALMGSPGKKPPGGAMAKGMPEGDDVALSDDEPEEDEDDVLHVDEAKLNAARAIRSAKSDKEFAKALVGFIKLCEGY